MRANLISILAAGTAIFLPFQAFAQSSDPQKGWSFSIGAGTVLGPAFLGDDEYQLSAAPIVSVSYAGRVSLSPFDGLTANVVNQNGLRVGPLIRYDFGRDEDGDNPFLIAGDETDDLDGLGDVDGTVELGGFIEYELDAFTANIKLRQGVNGHEGFIGEAGLEYGGFVQALNQTFIYAIGPEITFVDSNYNDTFFGVDAGQSAASGLDEFDADGGLQSYGVGGRLIVPFASGVSAVLFAGYTRLAGDAADSSLVQDRGSEDQANVGLFLNYTF